MFRFLLSLITKQRYDLCQLLGMCDGLFDQPSSNRFFHNIPLRRLFSNWVIRQNCCKVLSNVRLKQARRIVISKMRTEHKVLFRWFVLQPFYHVWETVKLKATVKVHYTVNLLSHSQLILMLPGYQIINKY